MSEFEESMKKINVLITGSGGREHALYAKVKKSALVKDVYVSPGNAGIPNSVGGLTVPSIELKEWCVAHQIGLIIPGPEKDLYAGINDLFADTDVMVFGPTKNGAQLEASKIFSKQFMQRNFIPTAGCTIFERGHSDEEIFDELKRRNGELVLKFDGLAAGKGVYVCNTVEEAFDAYQSLREQFGEGAPLLVENKLSGTELSIIGLTDGKRIVLLSPAKDHKRLLDDDLGPNTGGMGAYTPVPFCTPELLQRINDQIVVRTIEGFVKENFEFVGFLFFGVLVDENGNPFLLEYNTRLGDPETEVLLPALATDLVEIIIGLLKRASDLPLIQFYQGYFIDVVVAAEGYPVNINTGDVITLPPEDETNGVILYHAGTALMNGEIVTAGGRVLHAVASGETIEVARNKVYKTVESVSFRGKVFRTDIGAREV